MFTNYRQIRLPEEYSCPGCGGPVDAVCKDEGTAEKFWFSCPNERDGCDHSPTDRTFWSNGEQVTKDEAIQTFDTNYQ